MSFSLSDHVLETIRVDQIDLVCEVLSSELSEGCEERINHSASRNSREREENYTRMGRLILGGKEISITCDDDEPTCTGIGKDDGIPLCS